MRSTKFNVKLSRIFSTLLFIVLVFDGSLVAAQKQQGKVVLDNSFKKHFDRYSVTGSIVIYDLSKRTYYYFDEARTRKRFSPASTFKIFNSLVGLETGVIPDTSYVIPWDSVRRGNYAPWNRSNSLKSAFKYSVVWYYRELARRVGKERMQSYLSINKYGNGSIRDSLDGFWLADLGGRLAISQVEQIAFLRKLYGERLKFSKRAQRLVKSIMLMEEADSHLLYAKTGMSSSDGLSQGWYVGWVETHEDVYFFATHIESADAMVILSGARQGVTKSILSELKLIDN